MLILSRKKGESIKIGDDIEIFVTEVKGDKVRLGTVSYTHLTLPTTSRV